MGYKPIRVVIVDDSAVVRQILTDTLASDPQIEVMGAARGLFRHRHCPAHARGLHPRLFVKRRWLSPLALLRNVL